MHICSLGSGSMSLSLAGLVCHAVSLVTGDPIDVQGTKRERGGSKRGELSRLRYLICPGVCRQLHFQLVFPSVECLISAEISRNVFSHGVLYF